VACWCIFASRVRMIDKLQIPGHCFLIFFLAWLFLFLFFRLLQTFFLLQVRHFKQCLLFFWKLPFEQTPTYNLVGCISPCHSSSSLSVSRLNCQRPSCLTTVKLKDLSSFFLPPSSMASIVKVHSFTSGNLPVILPLSALGHFVTASELHPMFSSRASLARCSRAITTDPKSRSSHRGIPERS